MLQITFTIISIFILLGGNLFASDSNSVQDRENSTIQLMNGSKYTNTPYGYYKEQLSKSSFKAFDKLDLSKYPKKQVFVGYGLYDKEEKNCRYLDVPSNINLPVDFENITTIGNNTYAISRARQTYSECKALALQYSGIVYTPYSPSEYIAVNDAVTNSANGGIAKDFWIGYSKKDCNSEYLNDQGYEQSYKNFKYKHEMCNANNLYTYKKANSNYWNRTSSSDMHYCVIKITSNDYLRPIKVCAPWWRVERTWKLDKNDKIFEFNGVKYDFRYMRYLIDYPEEKTICTKVNPEYLKNRHHFTYTCNSYDSISASAACVADISLPQCHVDQCAGYAEKTCVKKDSFAPFKNYDVGYIVKNGVQTKVKTKDNKIINVYDCPPPPLASDKCLNKEVVDVFPAECPNSKCGELSSCLQGSKHTHDECIKLFPCEKIYGSVDNIIYKDGIAYGLGGVCSDGSSVTALIKRKKSSKKVCEEYNLVKETNTTEKSCISYSTSSNKIVSSSITDKDIYQDDPRCIRTNNIEKARPSIKSVISYENKGFFKTSIEKVFADGTTDGNELNATQYLLAASSIVLKPHESSPTSHPLDTNDTAGQFCKNAFSDAWYNKRYSVLKNADIQGFLYNATGTSTRNIKTFASHSSSHSISDDFGNSESVSNWGVAVFDSNINIVEFKNFNVSSSSSEASKMATYLNSLSAGTLVSIATYGDPKTNLTDSLKSALSNFGATGSILDGLSSTSAYILVGKKGNTRLSEKVGSSIRSLNTFNVQVPKVLAVSKSSSCSSVANSTNTTQFKPSFNDYDFSKLNISKDDVNFNRFCFLGGSQIQGDDNIGYIKNNGSSSSYFQLPRANASD